MSAVACLSSLLALFVFVQCMLPLGTAVQIGADEGFELAKTELCLKGHHLYSEIWNDQPPLHTFLLTRLVQWSDGPAKSPGQDSAHTARVKGGQTASAQPMALQAGSTEAALRPQSAGMVCPAHSVLWPRLLTSAFTLLLLASFFELSRRIHGLVVATLATALLIVSPGFIELSASCMLEIPALALAVCGLSVLVSQKETKGTKKCAEGASSPSERMFSVAAGRSDVAQVSKPAVSPTSKSANLSTARGAQGWSASADLEIRDTADLEVCATPSWQDCDRSRPAFFSVFLSSLRFLLLKGQSPAVRAVVAGVLFGLALQIKLVPAILLPLAGLLIVAAAASGSAKAAGAQGKQLTAPEFELIRASWRRLLQGLVLFGMALILAYVGIDLLIERGAYLSHFHQSWVSHFGAAKSTEYGSADDHPFDWPILARNWDTTVPALLGIGLLLVRSGRRQEALTSKPSVFDHAPIAPAATASARRSHLSTIDHPLILLAPLAWLGIALAVFTIHKPWWPYYYVHLALPLSWCAAIGLVSTARWVKALFPHEAPVPSSSSSFSSSSSKGRQGKRHPRVRTTRHRFIPAAALGLLVLCAISWQIARVYLQVSLIRRCPQTYCSLALAEIQKYKPFAHWMYADDIIYSFHAGIPMPPSLAVVPLKRLWSGEMTNAGIAAEMEKFRPGIILLKSPTREVAFQRLLNAEYRLVYQDGGCSLYIHERIKTPES